MVNIEHKIVGKTLTITIDLSKKGAASKSGKSIIIATTSGNADLGNGVKLGLNCYTPIA